MTTDDQIRWYVMRAYKAEKKAEEVLAAAGIEHYVPKTYALRIYHGVKSKHLVPAIPSMVFVHASRDRIVEFKQAGGNFLQFVTWKQGNESVPLVVPDRQMEDFIRVSGQYELNTVYLRPDEVDLAKGTKVRILGGLLDGVEGVFLRVKGKRDKRLVVWVERVIATAVDISPELIQVIE